MISPPSDWPFKRPVILADPIPKQSHRIWSWFSDICVAVNRTHTPHFRTIYSIISHEFVFPFFQQSPTPPQYVYWQKNDRMINYDDSRRDISIDTIPGLRTQSRLIIREPQISDSGNYTCSASNTEPASIYVFVSKGEYMCDGVAISLFIHFRVLFRRRFIFGMFSLCGGTAFVWDSFWQKPALKD